MRESVFRFKEFALRQRDSAQKVGTDSTVLGSWIDCSGAERILDIGTGTGILALMLAQKSEASILALEPEPLAAEEAFFNVQQSPWSSRIQVLQQSLQDYLQSSSGSFDLIVCNPPYYPDSAHYQMNAGSRQQARQTSTLPFDELLRGISHVLHPHGNAWLVLPVREAKVLEEMAMQVGLHVNTQVEILHMKDSSPKRMLLCLGKIARVCRKEQLILYTDNQMPTSAFYGISKDFLLWKQVDASKLD